MLPVTALSDAANKLRNVLVDEIDELEDATQIRIGHPKDTLEEMEKDKNNLNLFFYDVSYDGYPADGSSEDPFYVRLHCLITPVGAKRKSTLSAGENDLRLVGEVMRVLHQKPIISVDGGTNGEIVQLQIVPHPLNLDNLNHIWSTQGETAYRLSIAYEMALAPVPLAVAVERSMLVGEIGIEVLADMEREPLPEDGFDIETFAPTVPKVIVGIRRPDWSPHICFLDPSADSLNYTLAIPVSPSLAAGLILTVLVAGKPSEEVELVWDTWRPDEGRWERSTSSQPTAILTNTIDPEEIDVSLGADVALPIQGTGQAALYAERSWQRPDGSTITLRSNPLLVTVQEAST